MNNNRRLFLNQMSLMAGVVALSKPMSSAASISKRINTLQSSGRNVTVYQTNDLYGNLDPVIGNRGGLNQIKTLLKNEDTNGLLFDSGNFLGSKHTIVRQKDMIITMNNMNYHAAAIGKHELANGQDHLAALAPLMQFRLVNCNYGFNETLSKFVKPYIIINSGKFKVGVTGVGPQLNGIIYNDAIKSANQVAKLLKQQENCDLVICLSNLGYKQDGDKPDNKKLAFQSEYIDMIVSGQNRKLSSAPMVVLNKQGNEVIISLAARNGLMLGKTVFNFESSKQKCNIKTNHYIPNRNTDETFASSVSGLRLLEKQLISA